MAARRSLAAVRRRRARARGLHTPFAACAQLHQRDFPELPFPNGTDVLQVFLRPMGRGGTWGPDVRLVWRNAAEATDPLTDQPAQSWWTRRTRSGRACSRRAAPANTR